jgi:predicted PurR-regulated permease PerM
MNIKEKIEEIRKKPEHIRMRYVWGSLAISMFFIIIIWIFSMFMLLHSSFSQNQGPDLSPVKDQLQDFNSAMPSIQNISGDINNSDANTNQGQQTDSNQNANNNQNQNASQTDQSDVPFPTNQ